MVTLQKIEDIVNNIEKLHNRLPYFMQTSDCTEKIIRLKNEIAELKQNKINLTKGLEEYWDTALKIEKNIEVVNSLLDETL